MTFTTFSTTTALPMTAVGTVSALGNYSGAVDIAGPDAFLAQAYGGNFVSGEPLSPAGDLVAGARRFAKESPVPAGLFSKGTVPIQKGDCPLSAIGAVRSALAGGGFSADGAIDDDDNRVAPPAAQMRPKTKSPYTEEFLEETKRWLSLILYSAPESPLAKFNKLSFEEVGRRTREVVGNWFDRGLEERSSLNPGHPEQVPLDRFIAKFNEPAIAKKSSQPNADETDVVSREIIEGEINRLLSEVTDERGDGYHWGLAMALQQEREKVIREIVEKWFAPENAEIRNQLYRPRRNHISFKQLFTVLEYQYPQFKKHPPRDGK